MVDKKQRRGRQTPLDDGNGTRSTDFGDVDGDATDEISSSMNVISTAEERRQRHQGSGDDNGRSASDPSEDKGGVREDELRPKDGSMGMTTDANADADDEDEMPTGLPKKRGFEDYNPAARRHIRAGDSHPDASGRTNAGSSMPANPSPS